MKHETLQRVTAMQADIIMMMANLIEGRDGTTGEHVKRASIYVNMLLNRLVEKGIYKEELDSVTTEYIRNAAPLHDIGKITITDIILQKPASLTQEEYDIMKHHSAEGGRLIRENMGRLADRCFVEIAANMASYHHEKWNDSGYPDGLKGLQIPLEARIMAVADVFDALVSKRQYKEKMSLEQAFEILMEERGIGLEPVLVDTFLELKDELKDMLPDKIELQH